MPRKIHRCLVWTCRKSPKDENISYHYFTKSRYKGWMKALNRNPDENLSFENVICSKHFIKDDYFYKNGKKLLKTTAVPTINFPSFKNENIELEAVSTSTSTMVKTCAAYNCSESSNKGEKLSFYLFPKNPELKEKWITTSKIDNSSLSEFMFLCSKHFETSCFENVSLGTLKNDAVPTLFEFRTIQIISDVNSTSCISSSIIDTVMNDTIDLTEITSSDGVHSDSQENSLPFCIIKSCKNKGYISGITYHKIPNNNYQDWLNAIKKFVNNIPISLDSKVCSIHFKDNDFIINSKKLNLNKDVVPSLFLNRNLANKSSCTSTIDPFSTCTENVEDSTIIFRDQGIKRLRQAVLLSSIITPSVDIVKSDFALIDIKSIMNKTIENENNETNKIVKNFNSTMPNLSIIKDVNSSTQNLNIIKAMHNYCNVENDNEVFRSDLPAIKTANLEKDKTIQLGTKKCVPNVFQSINKTISNESDMEDEKKKDLLKKLRGYKKAYKKHKSLSRKQSEKILILENKLEENVRKNKKFEQRIEILNDIIQNLLHKREKNISESDSTD